MSSDSKGCLRNAPCSICYGERIGWHHTQWPIVRNNTRSLTHRLRQTCHEPGTSHNMPTLNSVRLVQTQIMQLCDVCFSLIERKCISCSLLYLIPTAYTHITTQADSLRWLMNYTAVYTVLDLHSLIDKHTLSMCQL